MAGLFKLKELWTYKTNDRIKALAFSDDGYLGVPSWDYCAYIFDQNGNLVSKYCENDDMDDVSFCCNKFGFVNWNYYSYIYDLSTRTWKKIKIGGVYDSAITMLENGFLAGRRKLAYFGFNGNKRWDVDMYYIANGPAVYNGYVYVPRYDWPSIDQGALIILRLSDGSEVKTITPHRMVIWATKTLKDMAFDELIILTNSPYIILPLALSQNKQGFRTLLEELKEEFNVDIKMDLEDIPKVKFYLADNIDTEPKEISVEEIYDGIPTIFEVDVILTRALNSF